jgi:hypothetical protein
MRGESVAPRSSEDLQSSTGESAAIDAPSPPTSGRQDLRRQIPEPAVQGHIAADEFTRLVLVIRPDSALLVCA